MLKTRAIGRPQGDGCQGRDATDKGIVCGGGKIAATMNLIQSHHQLDHAIFDKALKNHKLFVEMQDRCPAPNLPPCGGDVTK